MAHIMPFVVQNGDIQRLSVLCQYPVAADLPARVFQERAGLVRIILGYRDRRIDIIGI